MSTTVEEPGRFEVVIVGGGIAGSALAATLAGEGRSVLVLEKTQRFEDENRGELMWPWGVAEAKQLGLYDVLVAAGGHTVKRAIVWSSIHPGEMSEFSLEGIVRGVEGSLNLSHPQARQAILDLAEARGAAVRRGVRDVAVGLGEVAWTKAGTGEEARCRLVVGADGRRSTVRTQAGFEYFRGPVEHYAAGMLVRSERIPSDANIVCREAATHLISVPQHNHLARVYQCFPTVDKARFSGEGRERRFLRGASLHTLPDSTAWVDAEVAGPIGTFPCGDSWVGSPVLDGFALVGDAGGYNNVLIGQGLSLALRDARLLGEVLLGADEWSVENLRPYAVERTRRLATQRLTGRLIAAAHRHFRDADDERRRFEELLSRDEFLGSFQDEVFLGGLGRTEREIRLAEVRLADIERELTAAVGAAL